MVSTFLEVMTVDHGHVARVVRLTRDGTDSILGIYLEHKLTECVGSDKLLRPGKKPRNGPGARAMIRSHWLETNAATPVVADPSKISRRAIPSPNGPSSFLIVIDLYHLACSAFPLRPFRFHERKASGSAPIGLSLSLAPN